MDQDFIWVNMASTEPDRLNSCKTLSAGIEMVQGQFAGLDSDKLNEQIAATRMHWLDHIITYVVRITLILLAFGVQLCPTAL